MDIISIIKLVVTIAYNSISKHITTPRPFSVTTRALLNDISVLYLIHEKTWKQRGKQSTHHLTYTSTSVKNYMFLSDGTYKFSHERK